ncbi:MAG: hypothetical protein N0A24_09945 [Armatimonadetes bacterium]|nr:hypothetical protein [Armatimonadota bacterium]MDW8154499.1 hypothetical protein [Armatimonadota bacterium]
MGSAELEREVKAADDLLFRTDSSGRRLFFPHGTDRPGRVVPDEAAERDVRGLLDRRRRVLVAIATSVTLPSVFLLLALKRFLEREVGEWASLAITGVVALALVVFLSAVIVAVGLSYQGQLSRMVASWPEVPPLHSWQQAAFERFRAGAGTTPVWKLTLYLLGSGLFTLGGLAMLLLADSPTDRLVGALLAVFCGIGVAVFGGQLAVRLLRR